MRNTILTTFLCLVILNLATAQEYRQASGVRFGPTTGFSFKQLSETGKGLEALLSFRHSGMQLTGLVEFHDQVLLNKSEHLYAYYGFGPHIGYNETVECLHCNLDLQGDSASTLYPKHYHKRNVLALGINIMFGVEYRMSILPLVLGLEFKPTLELADSRRTLRDFPDFGISVKYILN